jgi:hypothetical protein
VALALAALPASAARIAAFPALRAVLLGLVPFLLVNGTYAVWWGGWSFGPRYWTEAMPLFAVLLGFGLAALRGRAFRAACGAAVGVAVALQAIGAFCYPSSWNSDPVSVDSAHWRLWDWRDSEISRCLAEGPFGPVVSYELILRKLRG